MPKSFRKFMITVLILFLLGFATPVCTADDVPIPVKGKIKLYEGKPEIILNSPKQIEIFITH